MVRKGYKQTEVGEIPEDWIEYRLEDISSKERPISYGIVQTGPGVFNGIPCIRVVDVVDGFVSKANLITTSAKISNAYKRTQLKDGDLIIPLRGKIGEIAVIDGSLEGANLTRGLALLSLVGGFNTEYVKQAFSATSTRIRLTNSLNGSALQEIPIATLRSFKIAAPLEVEQKKIAKALSDVDELIVFLEKLIAKKRDIKTATMQQLLTGKKRLSGFGEGKGYKQTELGEIPEDWDVVALGDYVEINSGESPSKFQLQGQGIPYFKVEQLNNDSKYAIKTPYFIERCKKISKNSIIFPKRGASILLNKIRILAEDSYMDTNLMTLTVSEDLDYEFLYYQLDYVGLGEVADTTSIPQINNKHIKPYKILRPKIEEQKHIAKALSDIDIEIFNLELRLEKTKAIKQGMMQELLTGRTRLIDRPVFEEVEAERMHGT